MNATSYYLLLSSIASSGLAACGGGDECPYTAVTKSKEGATTPAMACQNLSIISSGGMAGPTYGIAPERCGKLCNDSSMNTCELPDSYLTAFYAANGPADTPKQDAGAAGTLACPTETADLLTLSCSHQETRGSYHDGCPVAGRRPQGLLAASQRGKEAVADYLARSAHLEAASVCAFERLSKDLAALGAPAQLVSDCLEAARQEAAHTQVVSELARSRDAEPPSVELPERGIPSSLELALENIVEGVVRESYGALQAIVSGRTAAAPDVRSAMASIAKDEASHAALSARIAAWLQPQLSTEERQQVACAMRAAIADLRRDVDSEPAPVLRTELGLPSRTVALRLVDELQARLWRDSLQEIAA